MSYLLSETHLEIQFKKKYVVQYFQIAKINRLKTSRVDPKHKTFWNRNGNEIFKTCEDEHKPINLPSSATLQEKYVEESNIRCYSKYF